MGEAFVEVRLTKFGEAAAAGAPIHVIEGNRDFLFMPGEVKRVTKAYEWGRVLSRHYLDGHATFELVPATESQTQQEVTAAAKTSAE